VTSAVSASPTNRCMAIWAAAARERSERMWRDRRLERSAANICGRHFHLHPPWTRGIAMSGFAPVRRASRFASSTGQMVSASAALSQPQAWSAVEGQAMPAVNGAGVLEGRRRYVLAFCRAVAEPGPAESSSCLPPPGRLGRPSSVDLPATSKLERDAIGGVFNRAAPCYGVEVGAGSRQAAEELFEGDACGLRFAAKVVGGHVELPF